MRRNTEGPMNENGLSLQRWWAAATFGADKSQVEMSGITQTQMKQSWRDGECPCDFAAHFANVTPRERR